MIFIIRMVLIALAAYLLGSITPWWSIIAISVVVSFFMPGNNFNAFLSGFLGVGVLWMAIAWTSDIESGSNMSKKMTLLLQIEDPIMLIVGTGLIGAIAAGFGAFTGNSFRQIFIKKKKSSFYS